MECTVSKTQYESASWIGGDYLGRQQNKILDVFVVFVLGSVLEFKGIAKDPKMDALTIANKTCKFD